MTCHTEFGYFRIQQFSLPLSHVVLIGLSTLARLRISLFSARSSATICLHKCDASILGTCLFFFFFFFFFFFLFRFRLSPSLITDMPVTALSLFHFLSLLDQRQCQSPASPIVHTLHLIISRTEKLQIMGKKKATFCQSSLIRPYPRYFAMLNS